MFKIGDTVVYLTHGVGEIERREKREVLGETREYYVIRFRSGMVTHVPVDHAMNTGLRPVIDEKQADKVVRALRKDPERQGGLWSHRVQRNEDKLKQGEAVETAEVVRDLLGLDRSGKISSSEHLLRRKAQSLLAEELAEVWAIGSEDAEARIDEIVDAAVVRAEERAAREAAKAEKVEKAAA